MATVRLVLGGGSARGLLECCGALNAVADRGHEVAAGAGTSAGGVVLGLLAAGRSPAEIRNILLQTDFRRYVSTGWGAWLRLVMRGSLSNGKAYLALLRDLTRGRTFREAHFDVRITASDYSVGALRVFTRETDPDMELALAMRITSAMPLGFSAVEYEGRWYKDGGVYAHVPVWAGVRDVSERTVIFALARPPGGVDNPMDWRADVGLVREVERTVDLLVDANVEAQFSRAPEDAVRVFSDGLGVGSLEFGLPAARKQALYDHGYALTSVALEAGGL